MEREKPLQNIKLPKRKLKLLGLYMVMSKTVKSTEDIDVNLRVALIGVCCYVVYTPESSCLIARRYFNIQHKRTVVWVTANLMRSRFHDLAFWIPGFVDRNLVLIMIESSNLSYEYSRMLLTITMTTILTTDQYVSHHIYRDDDTSCCLLQLAFYGG